MSTRQPVFNTETPTSAASSRHDARCGRCPLPKHDTTVPPLLSRLIHALVQQRGVRVSVARLARVKRLANHNLVERHIGVRVDLHDRGARPVAARLGDQGLDRQLLARRSNSGLP